MEFNGFVAGDDPFNGRERTALYAKSQLEPGWREDKTGLYRDVHVVFPKESIQVVKDVCCITKEISFKNKCSIENRRLGDDSISVLLNSHMDMYSKPTQEAQNTVPLVSTTSESFQGEDNTNDVVEQCASMKLVMDQKEDFLASINIADDGSTKNTVSGRLPMVGELDTNYCHLQLPNSTGHRDEQQDNKVRESSDQGPMLATSMQSSATDASDKNCHAMEFDSKSEAENRRLIYDYVSSATMFRGSERRSLGITDLQPAPKAVETHKLDNERSESFRVPSQTNYHGESSFSALDPLSVPIEQSGPLSYSGSISHRSNSSNSTRSFAFPILPTEWNGSPVKMAEADGRQQKKSRRWRVVFLCCEF